MPVVSVLLPFRNAATTIVEAVRSVLAQDIGDFELLAIDDGSSDASAERLESLDDARLCVLENGNAAGIAGALEWGRARARGKWIARMDADDRCHPRRLGRQMAMAEAFPGTGVVTCRAALLDPQGEGMRRYVDWVNRLDTPAAISTARFVECPVIHPTAMIEAGWLDRVGGWREVPWAEDHDLWLRLLEAGCEFRRVGEVLFDWRDSPQRLTRSEARYGEKARTAMRAHFLGRLEPVRQHGVVIAGAGPIGKALSRALSAEGVRIRGFFEVNPRRIGERIHGVEVVDSGEIANCWRDAVLIGAVGVPGGRERVRDLALSTGRVEGKDFWAVC